MPATIKNSIEYETYLEVREKVMNIISRNADGDKVVGQPSEYWREELSNFDYMMEASPLIIKKLRHHCYHITGLKTYDYRTNQTAKKAVLEKRLNFLRSSGAEDIIIPESRILGGFGYEIDGELYNVDTLKFTEVLLGMKKAGLLDFFKKNCARNLIWEIGAGWGGFAYQFKTFFPDSTYLVTDFAELFVFSAVYLKTAFPQSQIAICDNDNISSVLASWQEYDFIFIPNTLTSKINGITPDIMVNMVSFQEMTSSQVDEYLRKAVDLACKNLYSLNRDCSSYNRELDNVHAIMNKYYILTQMPLIGTDYTGAMKDTKLKTVFDNNNEVIQTNYKHIIGALRKKNAVCLIPENPKVVLGMPVYNGEKYLADALDSILGQTYTDFALIVLNDASSDQSGQIIADYMKNDKRIFYFANEQRSGMINAWRKTFELCVEKYPSAEYFAWISDHDIWNPYWISAMLESMERNPGVVLCYPLTQGISENSLPVVEKKTVFSTEGIDDPEKRFYLACKKLKGAGNMVYGLFRADHLKKAGVFRRMLLPDRNLMFELSLYGQFTQVPLYLWFRRKINRTTIRRQRRTLFADNGQPLYIYLPWWFVSFAGFIKNYFLKKPDYIAVDRLSILKMGFCFLFSQAYKDLKKYPARVFNKYKKVKKIVIDKTVKKVKKLLHDRV